jgi:FADH2 O2-dependent halogenase
VRIAIVGSGFAGSILARLLRVQGHDVVLLERGRHPRFAIGESSTPLAAICLERLAARYDQPDLHALAAHGRWIRDLPDLGVGLKRGFTFFGHERDRPFGAGDTDVRLLVAASPNDAIADAHWVRADVDRYLVDRAVEVGVEYHDVVTLDDADRGASGWDLRGTCDGARFATAADIVIDATGPSAVVARRAGARDALEHIRLRTSAVYAHLRGVGDFVADARDRGVPLPEGPYPDERAAVHHLIEEGWLWVLPFDHGVVSAGFVTELDADVPASPEARWTALLDAYPSLAAQFGGAETLQPFTVLPQLQHRLDRAAGDRWAALPHTFTFVSPMFSTGIAWSLVAVERLAMAFEGATGVADVLPALSQYARLLEQEANHVTGLIEGAYAARGSFPVFAEYAMVYFAAASFAEASQRLIDAPSGGGAWAWEGFLGATDPVTVRLVTEAAAGAEVARQTPDTAPQYADDIRRLLEPRNVAGLADPNRLRLYPVDLEALVDAAPLLGLSDDTIRAALPRLRGSTSG